ncbi:retrovirus-related pol polyprotein from transposon TNT 1-94 [Tanacetum coccineum]
MSNTNNNLQTQTSNALHNAIMEAGGKDHPPMLTPGNYNPPYKFKWTEKTVPVAEGSSETTTEGYMENYKNVSQDIRDQLNAEAFGKFTSRDGESLESYYSRFYKMMNELVRNQCDVTNHQVNVQFLLQLQPEWQRLVTLVKQSQELKTVSYQKLYDILKQHQNEVNEIRAERLARTANPLALVAQQQPVYHPQNHLNHYTHNSSNKTQQAATRNRGKAIVNSPPPTNEQEPKMVAEDDALSKEKEIDKLMTLISLLFKKIYKPTNNNLKTSSNTSRANQDNSLRINRGIGYDNQRTVNVVGAKDNVGTQVVQQSGIQCYNCKEYGHVARECQKLKRAKDVAYHKEKMLLCKQEKAGFQLNAEQADCRDDTDDEPDYQELEAHYMYMAQIQEVTPHDADNSGPIFDTGPLQKVQNDNDNYNVFANDSEHPEQPEYINDTYLEEQGRDLLASLTDKLKCEIDDSKNRNKLLESSNKTLVDKLKGEIEDFKSKNKSLESSNNHFKKANNELSKTNQLMFKDLKKFQADFDRYHDVNYASKVEIDCAKAKGDLMSYKMESQKLLNEHTRKINDLNQTISEMKMELFAHQETISIMSQEKEAQNKFHKTRDDKELEKIIALENKIKSLDDIVYKTGQSVQTMNMLNRNCKTSFVKPEYLKKAQRANPRMYDIGCYNDNHALMLAPESEETIRLAQESRSKLSDLIRPFDYKKLNNLYDLFIPQREKSPEQRYFLERSKMSHILAKNENSKESFHKHTTLLERRMDESIPWDQKCKSSKELFKIKSSVDTIFDGVERSKQTIAKRTYFGNIDPFIPNTIEGNFCPQIRKFNADLEKFHLCLNEEMVDDLRYFNSLENEVDSLKSQLETQKTQFLNEIDRLSREYYYADHMNAILGVYTTLDEFTDLQCNYMDQVVKCERLEKELSKSHTISKSFEALQQHAINLELALQQYFSKSKSVTTNKVSNDFSNPVTAQILPQNVKSILKNTNVIAPGMYKVHTKHNQPRTPQLPQNIRKTNKRVAFSTRVIPTTSVSRPQLKSNQLEGKVMPNNSQGKKQQVEDHHRNFKFLNNIMSITTCQDSLNAKTSNVNFVCVTCGKCVLNDNHDVCVPHYINGMNSRTKQPIDVPVSTREPKRSFRDRFYHRRTLGYRVQGNITIKRVYYVKGLNHNLFSVGQFCDADLEVAFRKSTCFVHDLKGNDLLIGYIVISNGLWHRRLSHLNFDSQQLAFEVEILLTGLPIKFSIDHLCSFYVKIARGKPNESPTPNRLPRSSTVNADDAPDKRQQQNITPSTSTTISVDTPPLIIQTTPETTNQAPTQAPSVTAIENINQAETNLENAQVEEDEFINIF